MKGSIKLMSSDIGPLHPVKAQLRGRYASIHRGVLIATIALLCLHGGLLLASLGDYPVTIDSSYHVSMARYYAEHGTAFWDHINFGPRGRPNLQGPLLHMAIGALGRILGGHGDDYVLANAILAVVQWAAAMGTAAFFALELGGEWAMLFAVALLSGAAFAAISFAVGIPSGWLFILTPWAIYFFLRDRLVLASLFTTAAIYVHIGGYLTTPIGIVVAALMLRRWRQLFTVGAITVLLTAPYTVHLLRYLGWLSGVHSHPALLFDPLVDLLALAGTVQLLRRPIKNTFLVAWLCAPLAWLTQDPSRFILQSALAGSVIGAIFAADMMKRLASRRAFMRAAVALVVMATVFPLGIPSLAPRVAWAIGLRFPRAVDWKQAKTIAHDIKRAGLDKMLVEDYIPSLCPALAVYAPITCEKGHWVEVQPRHDPADALSAGSKVYVLAMPPNDPTLAATVERGWVRVYGGTSRAAVATLTERPPLRSVAPWASAVMAREAQWLSEHAVNNSLYVEDWRNLISPAAMRRRHERLFMQRTHAGRIELAFLLYAYSLEGTKPKDAWQMRKAARGFGVIAGFLSDDLALDFESDARVKLLKDNLAVLTSQASGLAHEREPSREFLATINRIFSDYLDVRGHTFAERPPNNNMPWKSML